MFDSSASLGTISLMHGVHLELAGRFPPFYHLTAPVEGVSLKIIFQRLDLNKDLHIRVRLFKVQRV